MNKVHTAIIAHVRTCVAARQDKVAQTVAGLSDQQMMTLMFSNYRGKGTNAQGLRLTNSGLQFMLPYFKHYDMTTPESRDIRTGEILYLDRNATLPYYCAMGRIVVFETTLGMKLRLWGGDISAIIKIESL